MQAVAWVHSWPIGFLYGCMRRPKKGLGVSCEFVEWVRTGAEGCQRGRVFWITGPDSVLIKI